ncbi:hypothetical protein WR25_01131 [Diploscapter pachys]|uniref:Uncharacterized protein n=1 Tax=Diploscapter pachys TaxID=2018661 RepID=A0A2A2KUV7_9BILA|nr:hypothetical protein WR25_01131 [Diploscapter pachys]
MGVFSQLSETAKSNPFSLPVRKAACGGEGSGSGAAGTVELGTPKYYALCAFGGVLSCGITHTAMVPLDLVKCRIQVNPVKYTGIGTGFKVTVAEEGARALAKGWAPTLVGYSLQGLGKFGFYEVFKNLYSNILGEENAYLWRTSLYLAASASAEFFADIMLAPMEATKVRIQTQPGAPSTLRGCASMIYKTEGLNGFFKGLPPLWMRQIPYTMMKFACFERTVELLYQYVVPKPRADCTKGEQLIVTFIAGYIAGVFCAVVSHPADTIVSKLNQDAGASAGDIVKKLGFAGLWKGLTPRIIMIGTLTALQWFIYDSVKVALGLPRPPPPQMPESLKAKLAAQMCSEASTSWSDVVCNYSKSCATVKRKARLLSDHPRIFGITVAIDLVLGYVVLQKIQDAALFEKFWQNVDLLIESLNQLIDWLTQNPAGLKLNEPVNLALASFFRHHVFLWHSFVNFLRSSRLWEVLLYGLILGLSTGFSIFYDLFSLLTLHIILMQLMRTSIASLWRIVRGKKWNPLRQRQDTIQLDSRQQFVSTVLFTISLFLLPTILVYFFVFRSLRLIVLCGHKLIALVVSSFFVVSGEAYC